MILILKIKNMPGDKIKVRIQMVQEDQVDLVETKGTTKAAIHNKWDKEILKSLEWENKLIHISPSVSEASEILFQKQLATS